MFGKKKKNDNRKKFIEELKKQEFKDKLPASSTMYLTLWGKQRDVKDGGLSLNNILINNSSMRVDKRGEDMILQVYLVDKDNSRIIEELIKYIELRVSLMITDDPLPLTALSSVNLGCFRLLIDMSDAKFTEANPLTFVGKWDNFRQHLLLPQR